MKTLLVLGLLQSLHPTTPELDRTHPVVEYGNFMYYKNSFGNDSFAAYGRFDIFGVDLKLGVTTGYSRRVVRDGRIYRSNHMITDDLALFFVPSYSFQMTDEVGLTAAVVGNALAAGLTWRIP